MKFKQIVFLATVVFTLGLLLGTSAAQTTTVDLETATAVRINNLEVDGTLYNVTFTAGTWPDAYGGQPPQLDVTAEMAPDFIEAINTALTDSEANSVGEPGATEDAGFYMIATAWDEADESWVSWLGGYYSGGRPPDGEWIGEIGGNEFGGSYPGDTGSMWTIITQVEDGEPGPATLISPKGTITEITPTYTWNPVATSSYYFFQVRKGADNFIFEWYTADEANCGDGTSECSAKPETELADGSYNWRILSWNDFGLGPWSDPLSFNVNTTGPNVIVDENGNVIRIENLPVVDETTGVTTIYNVRFVTDEAFEVYGNPLNFFFTSPEDDETVFDALQTVTDVLNAEDPIPLGASSEGSGQFFIGYTLATGGSIVAVGGENIPGGGWGQCETGCTSGAALYNPYEQVTWVDFDRVVDDPAVVQVFRTNKTYKGNFSQYDAEDDGLAGGDAICQERAEAAGLAGTWSAWLSTSDEPGPNGLPGVDARDRILDGRYELVDGTVIADDKADLTDGLLNAPINLNEFGSTQTSIAWTGTQFDGTDTGTNCSNWTSSTSSPNGCPEGATNCGVTGASSAGPRWTNESPQQCNSARNLYCFGGGE